MNSIFFSLVRLLITTMVRARVALCKGREEMGSISKRCYHNCSQLTQQMLMVAAAGQKSPLPRACVLAERTGFSKAERSGRLWHRADIHTHPHTTDNILSGAVGKRNERQAIPG
jgi:hypothetical protein